jgi:ribose 5-phosphate isomerase B
MKKQPIYLGADHNGFYLKERVEAYLAKRGYDVHDEGDAELRPEDDFPLFAQRVAIKVLGETSTDPRGILLCGGAQGMAMAANRFRGIRASVVWDEHEAKMTRNDNDSNILCLPARILEADDGVWQKIIDVWRETPFAGAPRYVRRNQELDELA